MEQKPIPKPVKSSDKGITAELRQLHGQFSVLLEGVSRETIYTTCRRLGFRAITRTEGTGLRVWRGDDVKTPEITTVGDTVVVAPPMTEGQTGWLIGSPGGNLVELADDWTGWTDERDTLDDTTGEVVYYRQHLKNGKRKEIRRETYFG